MLEIEAGQGMSDAPNSLMDCVRILMKYRTTTHARNLNRPQTFIIVWYFTSGELRFACGFGVC